MRFSYEILPLVVHKAEARPAVYHFATQLCAIVGGCARHAAPSVRVQRRGGWCVCGGGGGVRGRVSMRGTGKRLRRPSAVGRGVESWEEKVMAEAMVQTKSVRFP